MKSLKNYRKVIEKNDHSFLVFEDERIDDLHVGLLDPELYEVGQVLEAFGDHDQRTRGCRWGRFCTRKMKVIVTHSFIFC
jgi:hypothetical protein